MSRAGYSAEKFDPSGPELVTKGNGFYKIAQDPQRGSKVTYLQDAIRCYREAIPKLISHHEKAICYKMMGKASAHIATLSSGKSREFYYRELSEAFSQALKSENARATEGRPDLDWIQQTIIQLRHFVANCYHQTHSLSAVESMIGAVSVRSAQAACFAEYAKLLFHAALDNIEDAQSISQIERRQSERMEVDEELPERVQGLGFAKDEVYNPQEAYQFSCRLLQECHRPLGEAEPLGWSPDEISDTRKDVQAHLAICQSALQRSIGDQLLRQALEKEETLNMDLVWDIIDRYHYAIVLARGGDMEQEAIAHSRLGIVFGDVLKMPERAHTCCKECVNLALSMWPRQFATRQWFLRAQQVVERHQQQTNAHASAEEKARTEKEAKENAPIYEELKSVLDTIAAKAGSAFDLLRYVYQHHPPTNPDHKMFDPLESKTIKKAVLKAISHYHPDKNSIREPTKEDRKKYVLCTEITKHLNSVYTTLKECS